MNKIKILSISIAAFIGLSAFTYNNDRLYEISKNIEIFVKVFKEINSDYVDDIDPGKLMRTGIDAMLKSLDPYTNYISESQVESYRINTEGKYKGIGAIVKQIDDYVTIVELYENSPVLAAGLAVGDQIIEVDGQSTKGKSIDDVNKIMRGVPGTSINITVQSPSSNKSKKVDLIRSDVSVPNVPYSGFVDEGVAYVNLSTFTPNASRNVQTALEGLAKENDLSGVVLDLRNNGGGLLAEAINLSNLFIPKNESIVSTKGKIKERDKNYKTTRDPYKLDVPLVVMINKSSASASEIVSGVMQDLDRGVVIGQRSYGKGLVQNTKEVGYNSRIKLTTSKYYIPSGRCIQSVDYEEGEPKDIPDDERAQFRTRNGRLVLDGGGITPDIKLDPYEKPLVLKALEEQHVIFKYVNDYLSQRPSLDSLELIDFSDFEGFKNYIQKANFRIDTDTEEKISELRKSVEEDGFDEILAKELANMESAINTEKELAIDKYSSDIISAIEKEIATRYFFQRGKAFQRLKNDPEVQEAISILVDITRYDKTLKS